MTDFAASLHRAAWRGVPFGMESASAAVGRRKVRHDYPYRDTVWLEDQGKLPRAFRLAGFLVGDSAVYGGGGLQSQIRRIETAAETNGPGILVHPTRGRLTVDLVEPIVITERWDEGNIAELQFSFVHAGLQSFPAIAGALGELVGKAAGLADAAGLTAFSSAVLGPLKNGVSAIASMSSTAADWVGRVQSLARDATGLYGTVSQLGGADFGRYFNGRNSGFLAGLVSPYAGAGSVADLIALGSARRADIATAGAGIVSAISRLGLGGAPADVAGAVQATVATLRGAVANPADGVRMLGALSRFAPLSPASRTPAGTAISDLFQRAAASAIARASATYAPSSADDAQTVRGMALAPIEAAIARAGETGSDDVFQAFRALRKTVVEDLGERGGALARLTRLALPSALPSVVIAQRQYADATRADELVTQADPIHPWFMPLSFAALGS